MPATSLSYIKIIFFTNPLPSSDEEGMGAVEKYDILHILEIIIYLF